MSTEAHRGRLTVPFTTRRFGHKRQLVIVLSVLAIVEGFLVFVGAFDRVGGPGLEKGPAIAAAQSLLTVAGILAATTAALSSIYLGRFFESAEPFIQSAEPSVTNRFLQSLTVEEQNKMMELYWSDRWPLDDPELGAKFTTILNQSFGAIRATIEKLMMVYPNEMKQDILLTLGLLVASMLFAIGAVVGPSAEFLGLSVGALLGGTIALSQSFSDAQNGLKDWLVITSRMRVVNNSVKTLPGSKARDPTK